MQPLSRRDGLVIGVCAGIAVLTTLALSLVLRFDSSSLFGDLGRWSTMQIAQVPECAALAAVVLTARAFVAVGIAALTAVVSLAAAAVGLVVNGFHLGMLDYLAWGGFALLLAVAFLVADLMALQLGRFTVATGALAGLGVSMLVMVINTVSMLLAMGFDELRTLPGSFLVQEYLLPPVALVAAGAVAGLVAQLPQWSRAGQSNAGWGVPPVP